jgi:glycine cleavage system regulatory protein
MGKMLVLTFIAKDRPGLVEKLSEAVTDEGGNWLESRMAHLAEKFAGIARIEIPGGKVSSLKHALTALEAEGFHVTVEEATAGPPPAGPVFRFDLVGPDHPGIVRDISHCLAERGVSVEEMETHIRGAPMGGGTLFYAQARVRVPPNLSEEDLRQALEALAGTLIVDITLREETLNPDQGWRAPLMGMAPARRG